MRFIVLPASLKNKTKRKEFQVPNVQFYVSDKEKKELDRLITELALLEHRSFAQMARILLRTGIDHYFGKYSAKTPK